MSLTTESRSKPDTRTTGDAVLAALAVGVGTAVVMWSLGYASRLIGLPSALVLGLMVACHVGGGVVAGRVGGAGFAGGARAGFVTALVNLLVLGSFLSGEAPNRVVPAALWWLPGSLVAGALLGGVGAVSARRTGTGAPAWLAWYTRVAAFATFCLLVVGGVVTGHEAGLAVVDWPNSYGYNMFLYPLSRMTGGIYFEHAHRLFGSLVGLVTLVLAVTLHAVDRRRWLRWLSIGALLAVIVQGVLGGLRVTGTFTTSTTPEDMSPSLTLAIVHGVFGQLFFSMMVAIAAFTSRTWRRGDVVEREGAKGDRWITVGLVAAVIVQLVLGAVLRHVESGLTVHITMAVFVVVLAVGVGVRAWAGTPSVPVLTRLGPVLIGLVVFQLLLGIGALIVTTMTRDVEPRPWIDVLVTTAHQSTGAVLLALSVLVSVWTFRFVASSRASATR